MVVHLVRRPRYPIDERNAVRESIERERLRQHLSLPRPPGQPTERALNFQIRKLLSHAASELRVRAAVTDILPRSGDMSHGPRRFRRTFSLTCTALAVLAGVARAQASGASARADSGADSVPEQPNRPLSPHYRTYFALGAATSLALHETAHIMTSVALGAHPTFGFNNGRPTIYSGIIGDIDHHKQFLFSAAGLTVQTLLDEAILDVPHPRGSAFERGVLAGGLGTTIFYLTIGRTGSVSDVELMAAMHGMISALQIVRIHRDGHYANFFGRPGRNGGFDFGVEVKPQ
jgi:hypothetical protein